MQVLIIEDELPAANRLVKMLESIDSSIQVTNRIDSVEASVKFLQTDPAVDLIFMDIQLADGLSFDILSQVNIQTPVIFTTAFDQYTLKAFKLNSIDYLLKPIDEKELRQAVDKYNRIYRQPESDYPDKLLQLVKEMNLRQYKERLLIKRGQQLSYLKTNSIAYCFADGKLCYAVDFSGNRHMIENNLSVLEEQLQPSRFFRINRHLLVNIESVKKVHTWLGGRLKLEIDPGTSVETIVSRERVNAFKEWLGQ
ncbi:MAG TPA: LytTR family DNA-binding domain-containing protein [Ferruginibacter sp.]|nr:LytTR family DNA-binding domain-containing protein [Ferruginibacter sp.]HNF02258.1 LytTR family DNA-binding domain-containing protein [Ferruginibacter sp.]HNG62917.1 LytTR family DNA-binding domain-containing protein [Ferruginibacter sp.]HNH20603.1 LytTR family DNA-binding domain-containing protein [Ferruginibacter sp.]HNJ30081.1 LytTR family DNA-binding domain-containing protein [Ferruginibacter sp.]